MTIYNPGLTEIMAMTEKRNLQYLLLTSEGADETLKKIVSDTMQESGIEKIDLEATPESGLLARTIQRAIEQADVVIADLTGLSRNVMYELGYADALRKPILPIIKSIDAISADLAGHQFLVYQPENPDSLRKYLKTWASHTLNAPLRRSAYESV